MTRRVQELAPCRTCGGRLVPVLVCDGCGSAAVMREVQEVGPTLACPDCGASNATKLLCESCHGRIPYEEAPGSAPERRKPVACPVCATFVPAEAETCPTCGQRFGPPSQEAERKAKSRRSRRIRGDYDELQAQEIRRIPGMDADRAQALLHAGYNAIWKLKRASEAEVARVPGIGPEAGREILAGLRFTLVLPPRRSKEEILDEEFVCPLCGCVTSAFATSCVDCRAAFDEEEMDEATRLSLLRDGQEGLLAFYDVRLLEDSDDEDLWYARGLLLEAMGLHKEALSSFDRAAALNPAKRRIAIARTRVLAKASHEPNAAAQLRETLRQVVDTAALDLEIEDFQKAVVQKARICSVCDEPLPTEATGCPICGTPVEPPKPKAPERTPTEPTPELEALDSLLSDFERSVEEEPAEEPPIQELLEDLGRTLPEAPVSPRIPEARPAPKREPRRPAKAPPAPAEKPHVSTPAGFRSRSVFQRVLRRRAPGAVNGVVNGAVNGRGLVNGFINGRGRVNGFINGKGFVNGLRLTQVRVPRARGRATVGLLATGLILAAGLLGFMFVIPQGPPTPILIDGSFGDWTSVPYLDIATPTWDPNVEIARYASLLDRDILYLFASTQGDVFSDPVGYDGLYFLLDTDGDPATGYRFAGHGADYVFEAYGGNGTLAFARAYSFTTGSELNWSQRQGGPPIVAAASAEGLELRVSTRDLVPFVPDAFRVAVYADNYDGAKSVGLASLSKWPGAIRVDVSPITTVIGSGPTDLLEIRVRALGLSSDTEQWSVSSFRLNATPGVIASLSAESVILTRGRPTASIRVSVQAPGYLSGDAVEVEVLDAAGPRPISLAGGPVRAYVEALNMTKRVDGLFADWATDTVGDTDPTRVNNTDVDIVRYGAATNGSTAYFFVQVQGTLLGGSLPQKFLRIAPGSPGGGGGGGPTNRTPEPRRTGEDILRVYFDVNRSEPSGEPFGGIFADYLVEVRGQGGRITSRQLFAWSNGWTNVAGNPVAVAKDITALEGSLPLPTLDDVRMVFAATDWTGVGDITPPALAVVGSAVAPTDPWTLEVHAPEFETIATPILGTVLLGFAFARRRRRAQDRRPDSGARRRQGT